MATRYMMGEIDWKKVGLHHPNPGCRGCIHKSKSDPLNAVCNYLENTQRSRVAMGIRSGADGRCALYNDGTDAWKAEARTLYDAGRTDPEIARTLGLSKGMIFRWRQKEKLPAIRRHGVKRKPPRAVEEPGTAKEEVSRLKPTKNILPQDLENDKRVAAWMILTGMVYDSLPGEWQEAMTNCMEGLADKAKGDGHGEDQPA